VRLEAGRLIKFAREEPFATGPGAKRGDDESGPLGGAVLRLGAGSARRLAGSLGVCSGAEPSAASGSGRVSQPSAQEPTV